MRWLQTILAVTALILIAGRAVAGESDYSGLKLYPPIDYSTPVLLAQNDRNDGYKAEDTDTEPFEESMFTADKLHGYLGGASLLAALVAGATAPDNENPAMIGQPASKGVHHYAGITAAALGGAAVISGFLQHSDDLTPDFLDPDTAHMLLGVLGTAAYVYAVSKGPKKFGMGTGNHAAAGMAGAGLMATAIYLEF